MPNKNIIQLTVGPIATNCWIYRFNADCAAIIDPGDEADNIIAALQNASLSPKYILLTHGHFDHIIAVPKLKAQYPDAQIAIHGKDAQYLGPESFKVHERSVKYAMGSADFIDAIWENLPPADILLEEGSAIGPFTVLNLPGHTPGSSAFWDREAGVLFTGDTLFRSGYGRTDLPGGSNKEIFESLKRLFGMDGNIGVYPGHGEPTTIAEER
ncbi:MAG: MBL fold metallo-hydrolase [Treponema sp.]|nr:MBL fold metallo-hydrolase [Treponema sp.]MCL2238126.1 MBL fold metallo-hydrolase [Treponema sp.]